MEKLGYSETIMNTIKWMYAQTKIVIGNKEIFMKKGVIQGGILSPQLFNIFYDTLISKLDNMKIFIIAYADDISLAFTNIQAIKKTLIEIKK